MENNEFKTYKEVVEQIKLIKERNFDVKGEVHQVVNNLNIKTYLPIEAKRGYASMLAQNICETKENGILFVDDVKREMIDCFLLWKYIEIEKDDNDFDISEFDLLSEVGLYEELKEVMPKDYFNLTSLLWEYADQLVRDSIREN